MKLILKESVPSLGEAGEIVSVKPGFARNYLLPQGKAIVATEGKVKELEHHKRVVEEKLAKELKELHAVQNKVEALALEVKMKVGEEGKLFGSVTSAQLAELLAENGFEIDRRRIVLAEPIKSAGEHAFGVKLHRDLVATVKVTVSPEE
jgi:large subunit ribosomal protein L9